MAPSLGRDAALLLALLASATTLATAQFTRTSTASSTSSTPAFWTYTSRYQPSIGASYYTYANGRVTSYTTTITRIIKPSVTPTASPSRVSTYGSSYYDDDDYYSYDDDLQLVYAYYGQNAVAESDLVPTTTYNGYASTAAYTTTTFYMPATYTAPTSCPTPFTVTMNATVSVPTEVVYQITPTAKITSQSTYATNLGYMRETWLLTAGAAPVHTSSQFYYSAYVASCSVPPVYDSTGGSRSNGGSTGTNTFNDDPVTYCSWYTGCTTLKTIIIIVATVVPGLFLLGFLESFFWYRRLMLGKGCLRMGTFSWVLISLLAACLIRGQGRRSKEDQVLLREKWKAMSAGQKFKNWWRWGFRHRYPVPLLGQYSRNTVGIVPEGQPLPVPGMTAAGPMLMNGWLPAPGTAVGAPPNGQVYYYPPPGWVPGPNAQQYPAPPNAAYMSGGLPAQHQEHYGADVKEAPNVTEATVSPVQQPQQPYHAYQPHQQQQQQSAPQTVPSPVSAVTSPATTPAPPPARAVEGEEHHGPPQSAPPPGPPPPRPI